MTNRDKIWSYLMKEIGNPYGVAGLMGNIEAESAYIPTNLQNSFEKKLGFTDDTYTTAVDSGAYSAYTFAHDSAGYGLCQWTFYTRKEALYRYAKTCGSSIGSLFTQLAFMCDELRAYAVFNDLAHAKSVKEASDLVMCKYERPHDQTEQAKARRAKLGEAVYSAYALEKPTNNSLVDIVNQIEKSVDNLQAQLLELKKNL